MSTRPTPQRAAVQEALARCQDFVSAQVLHALLTSDGRRVGLTTVYRALHELEAAGGVDVIGDGDGGRLYRRRPAEGHRHYLICRSCGRSRPVEAEAVERWAERVAREAGYATVEHTVELSGVCPRCHRPQDGAAPLPAQA
nr:Fur family transcriptional regulator [Streptomyces aidingensis]